MTHVLIDARIASINDGNSTYVVNLIPRLISLNPGIRFTIVGHSSMADFWRKVAPTARLRICDYGAVGMKNHLLFPLRVYWWGDRPDVYFFPSNTPPVLAPGKLVFTLHDMTILKHPPYFDRFSPLKTQIFKFFVGIGMLSATRIIAISHYTKDSIEEFFGRRYSSKIEVIHHGCPPAPEVPADGKLHPHPYFFYAGPDRPHKNLSRLLQAYKDLVDSNKDAPDLLLAGYQRHPDFLRGLVSTLDLGGRVHPLGFVSKSRLDLLYRHALALVFPSLAEGFGFPILEAQSRGTAVVTSRYSGAAEVAGASAVLVDPYSVDSIKDGLLSIWKNEELRTNLVAAGKTNCARFDWDRAALATSACLLKAVES